MTDEPTIAAAVAFARAFEKSGGIPAMVKHIKASAGNRAAFYSHYAKLIPLQVAAQVAGQVDVNVNLVRDQAIQKLQSAFNALVEAELDDAERAARDVTPQPLEQVAYTRTDNDATRDATPAPQDDAPLPSAEDQNKNHSNLEHDGSPPTGGLRRDATTPAQYPSPVSATPREPTTTEKYLDWANNGGLSRTRWGPI